jgi:hypothetical protein
MRITLLILTTIALVAFAASAAIIKGFRPGAATNAPAQALLTGPFSGNQLSVPPMNIPTNEAGEFVPLFVSPAFTNSLVFDPDTNGYALQLFTNSPDTLLSPPPFIHPAKPLGKINRGEFALKNGSIAPIGEVDPGMPVYGDNSHDPMPIYGDHSHDPMPGTKP